MIRIVSLAVVCVTILGVGATGAMLVALVLGMPIPLAAVAAAALSNLVSNVPAVLLLRPIVPSSPDTGRSRARLQRVSALGRRHHVD